MTDNLVVGLCIQAQRRQIWRRGVRRLRQDGRGFRGSTPAIASQSSDVRCVRDFRKPLVILGKDSVFVRWQTWDGNPTGCISSCLNSSNVLGSRRNVTVKVDLVQRPTRWWSRYTTKQSLTLAVNSVGARQFGRGASTDTIGPNPTCRRSLPYMLLMKRFTKRRLADSTFPMIEGSSQSNSRSAHDTVAVSCSSSMDREPRRS